MKRGVVVSDLHAGSIYGMLPPMFETSEGVVKLQNPGQDYLYKCWDDFTNRAGAFNPDFIIVNGDVIDGTQRAQRGAELALPLLADQKEAAIVVLKLLSERCSRPKMFFIQGTEYHDSVGAEAVEDVARALGGEKFSSIGTGRLCREVLWLETEEVIVEAAHHISIASGFYRLTPLDREAQWSAMSAKDRTKGVPKSDLLIRSHCHYFSLGEHASKQIVTTPCWQLQTRYMRKHSVHRMHPDIGGLFIEVDGNAKKRGEAPCRVIKELYALPPVPLTKLE